MYEKPELVLVSEVAAVVLGNGDDEFDVIADELPVNGITCGLDD